jgi:ATP-dependent DNA helicase RecG
MVKCAVFEGVDKTGRMLDHAEIKENVFLSIDRAEQFVLRNVKKAAWINPKTGRREEQYEVPYLAIREAVSNAVAHRDYRASGNTDVAIFDDRIEVWSPGTLPHGVTLKDIRSKKRFSVPRNPAVSEALFLTGYIEKWGSGINKMNTLMIENGLATPEYEECFGGFLVTFQKDRTAISQDLKGSSKHGEGVSEGVSRMLKYISDNPGKRAPYISVELNVPQKTIKRWIRKLREEGKIRYEGSSKKGGYYIKQEMQKIIRSNGVNSLHFGLQRKKNSQ